MHYYAAGERVLLTLWVGALWSIGYLAVPSLFAALDDRILAGMLAGRMFTAVSYLGLLCGALLLASSGWRERRFGLRPVLLLVMLILVAVGEFWLQPMMAQLKSEGLTAGSLAAAQFARLHGLASVLYLANSLMGLVLVMLVPSSAAR